MSSPAASLKIHSGLIYLKRPWLVLAVHVLLILGAIYYAGSFGFDASSDTLVVEGDPDLAAYEEVVEVFGGDAFLFMTFKPSQGEVISDSGLATLRDIVTDLEQVEGVSGVFSVLDAPLLKSPPITLAELLQNVPTLSSPSTDLDLARDELRSSPFFSELLITRDGSGTAIKVDIAQEVSGPDRRHTLIEDVRAVQARYKEQGTLYLGGVPMIAADMVTYVKSDLSVFGGVVLGLMVVALGAFFRSVRWVIMPLLTAAVSVFYTVGLLGFLGWQATVISSNFVALLGITTISLTIHLIVHYRELQLTHEEYDQRDLVYETMRAKFLPCVYTALTTIAAFGSLTVSGILPVEYFGWMMCIGIIIAFVATYTLFPSLLLLSGGVVKGRTMGHSNSLLRGVGEFVRWRGAIVVFLALVLGVTAYIGITRVSLDNRFVDYFAESTEINRGMRYIDANLGGTIPFDVVLQFAPYEDTSSESFGGDGFGGDGFGGDEFGDDAFSDDPFGDDDFGGDDFGDDDFEGFGADEDPERYWYTRGKLDELERMHRFLESKPHVGKVLSLTSLEDFALEFTEGKKLTNLEIVGILGALPEDLFSQVIDPYADPSTGQLRLSGRVIEGGPSFDREVFRQEILSFGAAELKFTDGVAVTGMMVLFNTMLSQLLDSQLNTLIYILLIVFVMFLVLLRSIRYAILGIIPNVLASATVIGAMGFAGIPLDMMTTTIAAICIGIGVDNAIHYLHRFRSEYSQWGDPRIAVSFSHESIGRALLYTSITVVAGFSVLGFSNFVPTVMFGFWTAVAMVLALIANLTLLPALLVLTHGDKATEPHIREDVPSDPDSENP